MGQEGKTTKHVASMTKILDHYKRWHLALLKLAPSLKGASGLGLRDVYSQGTVPGQDPSPSFISGRVVSALTKQTQDEETYQSFDGGSLQSQQRENIEMDGCGLWHESQGYIKHTRRLRDWEGILNFQPQEFLIWG